MSIITFWNNRKEQTGQTLSIAAIATYMAIEHNYKILVVSTGYKDLTLDNCFWNQEKPQKKNFGIFGPNTNTYIGNGIEGLIPIMRSNKVTPETITNYTKVIFTDRLEILRSYRADYSEYKEATDKFTEILTVADNYYDLILVDLDKQVGQENINKILQQSTIVVTTMNQRLSSINSFIELKEHYPVLNTPKALILIGRYDRNSKYTLKNITRYLKEKNKISTVPYNTLFFEAAEEAAVPDLFLRLRKVKDEDDINYLFIQEIKRCSENIIYRLQDLKMKM